jgi:hypothetical protein
MIVVAGKSRITWPMLRSPRWNNSTISALSSRLNDRQGRGFFLSILHFDVMKERSAALA